MTRTTPPRPVDLAEALPPLAPLARTAIRLHPRPGAPGVRDSSVGGPLLWPADEPWPRCDGPHVEPDRTGIRPRPPVAPKDVLAQRRVHAAEARRPRRDPRVPQYTAEEQDLLRRASAGVPWPSGPVPLLPLAQVYLRGVPLPDLPGPGNLLQVLWCPFDHHPPTTTRPRTAVFWRSDTGIGRVLREAPAPAAAQHPSFVPGPCLLHPERVTEYPNYLDLSQDSRELVRQWCGEQAVGAGPGSAHTVDPTTFYWDDLSTAPGWKIGGWPQWGLTDPVQLRCSACGETMVPLFTIASLEWEGAPSSWIPVEDRERAAAPRLAGAPDPGQPTGITIGDLWHLQVYSCPASPRHPHAELTQ